MSIVALVIAPLLVSKDASQARKEAPKAKVEVVSSITPEQQIEMK
jgi:hypothetical protein